MPVVDVNQQDIVSRRERGVVSLIRAYTTNLEDLLARAQARTLAELRDRLDIEDGRVKLTMRTQQALRGIDRLFMQEMDRVGFSRLIQGFTGSFASQVPSFRESLTLISSRSKIPLERLEFTSTDAKAMVANAQNAQVLLREAVQSAAMAARQNALMALGGLSFRDLSDVIAKRFRIAASRSEAMAKTAISTYYRLLSARSAERIEQALPEGAELRYRPAGPLDKLTRPFCRKLMQQPDRTYTREEIEAMDNQQIPNPFLTFGGFKCRHVWAVDSITRPQAMAA